MSVTVQAQSKPPSDSAASRGFVHSLVILAYTLLTGVMTWPLITQIASAIPGDSFDGWQNYWNLWWMKMALVDRLTSPLLTDLLYYPTGVTLYFHTLNPFNGLVTLPIQISGSLILAYNSVVWISWVLGGYGMFLLACWVLRNYTVRSPGLSRSMYGAAFLAGIIFTFSPFHMAHLLGHMQVMSLQWIPFYILYLLRGCLHARQGRPWWRDGILAGLFLTWVGLCDWYFVLYLFLFTLLYLLWHIRYLPRMIFPPLVAGLIFVVLLSPMLLPMVQEALRFEFMQRPRSDLYILSATLADFLIPNRLHTLFRPQSFTWIGNQVAPVSERTIAIGYLPLILTGFALWWRSRQSRFWLAAMLFFMLVALGPVLHVLWITQADILATTQATGWSPYEILNRLIPFMRISRSVSRFALMVQLAVAVLAAIGFAALAKRFIRPGYQVGLVTLATLLILGEFWVAPYPLSPPDTPAIYTTLAQQPGNKAVLNVPMNYDRPGYLLYQTVHQKPLSVAYISRDDPRTYTERVPVLQHLRHLDNDILVTDPVQVGQTVLHDLAIGWIVADRYKMPDGRERSYTTELIAAIMAGQIPFYEDERVTVYAVTGENPQHPYLRLGDQGWGPLQISSNGERWRTIDAEGATLEFMHVTDDKQVEIQYRTEENMPIQVWEKGTQQVIATLPPAPAGDVVTLAVTAQQAASGLIFISPQPAQIGALQLSPPLQE